MLPGVDRTIALLQGNGFALTVANRPPATLTQPYAPFDFRGDDATTCALIDGPVQDLNLMVRRTATRRRLDFVEVVSSTELTDFELAVVLSGHLRIGDQELSRLDALRPTPDPRGVVVSSPGPDTTVVGLVISTSRWET